VLAQYLVVAEDLVEQRHVLHASFVKAHLR
jgi:hypothetical protein